MAAHTYRDRSAWEMASSGQVALPGLGPAAGDGFRFTWRNTRIGAACWIEYRGFWRKGIIVHRGRKSVRVAVLALKGRTRYVSRPYDDLRRRVVKPQLRVLRKVEL